MMAFQFKIQILGIRKPPVWRRMLVPENYTFEQLHQAIQNCFGWKGFHLYQFSQNGYNTSFWIARSSDFEGENCRNSSSMKLKTIFKYERQTFMYIYDFGSNWYHKIILEHITSEVIEKPFCLAGKGKCPPEDCGGIEGYQEFLKIINNPKNERNLLLRKWIGLKDHEDWDAKELNFELINEILRSESNNP